MKKYLRALLLLAFTAGIFNVVLIQAEDYFSDEPYFSYERFLPAMVLLESIPDKSGPQGEINKFSDDFSDGLYALSSEEYTLALQKLLRARRIWPEYFGTDFLIALVYDSLEDHRAAAGYYKGYLQKLRTLEAGGYRISGGMIQGMITSDADSYNIAYELVRDHLEHIGIDIDNVKIPLPSSPSLVLFAILVFISLVIYVAVHYFIAPHIKRQKKIKTLIGEYWVCKNCKTANLIMYTECEGCGWKR